MELHPGMAVEKTIEVELKHVASHLGSGGVPVYATPSMVLHMEETSRDVVDHLLGPREATVGAFIAAKHLAPTPVGMKVRIRSELVKVEGRMLTFKVEAWDEVEKIGEADHVRAIIDMDRFGKKIAMKKALANKSPQPKEKL
ncbi:MAG TPA: thioesterase family protein [Rectinemataceae bacterium]|nr:thioesterase family protein [Rectinemataceae bacterium]